MNKLFGREREVEELEELWAAAQRGVGRIAIVIAEAGGGKSSLLRTFTEAIQDQDAVLWGDCQDGNPAMPYWPWLYILPEDIANATLLQPSDSEAIRFSQFRAAAAALSFRPRPAVIVIDDLHWADGASLRFLEFFAPLVRRSPLLLLLALRPAPAGDVQATIGTLLRNGAVQLPLRPLDAASIEAVCAVNGQPPDPRIARISGGNPLLVQEYSRHLVAGGDITNAPPSLTALLHAELRRLSPDARRVAEIASLVEGAIPSDVLRMACAVPDGAFDEVHGTGMLVRTDGGLRWRHDALREAVRSGLPGIRRAEAEAALADGFRRLGLSEEMTVHGCRAGAAWDPAAAHSAAIECSRNWAAHYALELAAEYTALARSIRHLVPLGPAERLKLELFEGELYTKIRRTGQSRATLREAARLARELDDYAAFADVALAFGLGEEHGNARTDDTVALLREALERVPSEAHAVRAKLYSRLAWQALAARDVSAREALSADAVREARMSEDPAALATALMARCWALVRPQDFAELRATVDAAAEAARDVGDIELQLGALFHQFLAALTAGDVAAARATARTFDQITERSPLPYHRWYAYLWNATLALMDGKVDEAQRFVDELDPASTTQYEVARLNRDASQSEIWNAAGGALTVRGLELTFEAVEREIGIGWVFRPRLLACSDGPEAGRVELARAMSIAQKLPVDEDWLSITTELAAAAVCCGAGDDAMTLIEMLKPYADRWVVVANGASCRGPVSSFLAALARVAGQPSDAEEYARRARKALDGAGVKGLRQWLELTQVGELTPKRRAGGLTGREAEVLALVARGHSNQEIADELVLSVRTVQRHVENVYGRLGLRNRAGAALAAVELGLVSPGDVRHGSG